MKHISLLVNAGIAVLSFIPAAGQQPCLKEAWDSFNKKDYSAAVRAADDCIDQFAARAQRDQDALVTTRRALPKVGAVSDLEKSDVFGRGVLNDTGAAYFVKGRSAEFIGKQRPKSNYINIAQQAYQRCVELTYARTWDPQGWFWSTSEACKDRLNALGRSAGPRSQSH